jgi:uncharacterized glyoxalase superfamily protein PhnB
MQQYLAGISLVVNDYDEAIDFYTRKLSFTLLEDNRMSDTKRWVVIAPPGSTGCTLLLAKAANDAQKAAVGNQTGGRVFLFLHTNNFDRDYKQMQEAGIEFMESPRQEAYGKVVVFADLYGNRWDLIEPKKTL